MSNGDGKKIVLAYSGGLDTSVILNWLAGNGYEVVAYIANVGQSDDLEAARRKALETGASRVYVEDLREEFVRDYIFRALKANAIYEGRYLLGTSLARPLIAKRQIEIARKEGTRLVSHGATGKGNDQVRFELSYYALMPEVEVFTPWKDPEFLAQFEGRTDLLGYAEEHGIPVEATSERPYSTDDNLMHISYESGILEDPRVAPRDDMFQKTVSPREAPDRETRIEIHFKDGVPVKVVNRDDGTVKERPLELFEYLNRLAGENGIGRIDIVENRFIGIKSRGVYETPGGTVLRIAHMDIEGIAMDREVMKLRDMLSPKISELIYNGFWFSPEMDFLMSAVDKSQEVVDGVVYLSLYKGNVTVLGRESPSSLYDKDLASMDVEGGFNQQDSKGFINIHAVRLKAHHAILRKMGKWPMPFMKE
ncbi:MAG: argininosuccinate synthase [Deltaproteobacteria bacterium]|nr:argininosuccinate synthase [Deltaproteobacteria bacterium]MBW2120326.1 argininosuccinate synthase [Deltaproteobacteria bacterium]